MSNDTSAIKIPFPDRRVLMPNGRQEEGRDVTDDELKQIQSQREQTMQQWRDLA